MTLKSNRFTLNLDPAHETTPAFHIYWADDAKTVMYADYRGLQDSANWHAVDRMLARGQALAGAISHEFVGIVDVRGLAAPPPDTLFHLRRLAETRPRNIALVIMISDSVMLRLLFRLFCQVAPGASANYRLANSVSEAEEIITDWQACSTSPDA